MLLVYGAAAAGYHCCQRGPPTSFNRHANGVRSAFVEGIIFGEVEYHHRCPSAGRWPGTDAVSPLSGIVAKPPEFLLQSTIASEREFVSWPMSLSKCDPTDRFSSKVR